MRTVSTHTDVYADVYMFVQLNVYWTNGKEGKGIEEVLKAAQDLTEPVNDARKVSNHSNHTHTHTATTHTEYTHAHPHAYKC